jgi:hypothetical protein
MTTEISAKAYAIIVTINPERVVYYFDARINL